MQRLSEPLCFRDLLRFDIDGTVSVTYPVLMRRAFYNALRDCSVFFSCQHGRRSPTLRKILRSRPPPHELALGRLKSYVANENLRLQKRNSLIGLLGQKKFWKPYAAECESLGSFL
jgi:hypothetical protein